MKCKHCGAEINGNEKRCSYCNSEVEAQSANETKAGCPKCGSQNIKFSREATGTNRTYITKRGILLKNTKTGRATQKTSYRTVGLCQDCGYSWEVSASGSQITSHGFWWWLIVIMFFPIAAAIYIIKNYSKQPRDIWWWISAVLAFPITISLWIYKTEKLKINKWLRIAIIAVFWIVLFLVSPSSDTSDQKAKNGDTIETETTAEQVTESVSETTIVETIVESTAPETQPETTVQETTVVVTEQETTTEATQAETTTEATQAETTVAVTQTETTVAETTVAETAVAETTVAETVSEMIVEETVTAEVQSAVVVETQPETAINEKATEGNTSSNSGNYSTNDGIITHTENDTCAINRNSKTIHQFDCGTAYNSWLKGNVVTTEESIDSLKNRGYKLCGNCH